MLPRDPRRRRTRRAPNRGPRWLLPVAFAGLVIVALAVLAVSASSATVPERGGTFTEATVGVVTTLNPLLSPGRTPDEDVTRLLYAGLVRTDEHGALLPDLAARWEISADGRTYAFQLRPNLRWHDGAPLTARDVIATANLLRADDFPGHPDIAAVWRSATPEWIDETTVRFELAEPDSRFLAAATIGILPAHVIGDTRAGELLDHRSNAQPIGSGPFRFVSGTLDEIVLESNPDYHFGQPYLETMRLRFFPDEQSAQQAVLAGEADGFATLSPLPPLPEDSTARVITGTTTNLAALVLNVGDPALANAQVRQALGMALNREELVSTALAGWGEPTVNLYPSASWIRDPNAVEQLVTLDQARALLERAGWTAGPDGTRQREGRPLTVPIATTPSADRKALAAQVATQWSALGVQSSVIVTDTASLVSNLLVPHRFGAALLGIDLGANPDPYLLYHSSQAEGAGFNFSGYGHADLDRLVESIRRATSNEQRAGLLRDADGRNRNEATIIPLAFGQMGYLVSTNVQGIELGVVSSPADRFHNVHDWHVRTKRVFVRPGDTPQTSRAS